MGATERCSAAIHTTEAKMPTEQRRALMAASHLSEDARKTFRNSREARLDLRPQLCRTVTWQTGLTGNN